MFEIRLELAEVLVAFAMVARLCCKYFEKDTAFLVCWIAVDVRAGDILDGGAKRLLLFVRFESVEATVGGGGVEGGGREAEGS